MHLLYGKCVVEETLLGASVDGGAALEMPIAPGVHTVLAEGGSGSEAVGPLVVEAKQLPE